MGDLTTLARVRQYLGITDASNTSSDALLSALITAYSSRIEQYCGRQFSSRAYTEYRNGTGNYQMLTRQWPVISVAGISVDAASIPAGSLTNSGYRAVDASEPGDNRLILLTSYSFRRGMKNVLLQYTAGYAPIAVTAEPGTIPATPFQITLAQAINYVGGEVITFVVGGATLTKVTGTPTTGQYAISVSGVMTFAAADTGKAILTSYNTLGFPADLIEAANELVAIRYKSRSWEGINSKSLATETISYDKDDMPAKVRVALDARQSTFIPQ